jgi:hypothetical protein
MIKVKYFDQKAKEQKENGEEFCPSFKPEFIIRNSAEGGNNFLLENMTWKHDPYTADKTPGVVLGTC